MYYDPSIGTWLNGFLAAIALVLLVYYIWLSRRNVMDFRSEILYEMKLIRSTIEGKKKKSPVESKRKKVR